LEDRKLKPYKGYKWIVADPALLDGKLAIRGTQWSVSFILSCLAEGMSLQKIEEFYGSHVMNAVPEALSAAARALDVISEASFTPSQRASLLQVPGLDDLVAWLGFFPTFHDGQVVSITLDRPDSYRIALYTFEMTKETNQEGFFILQKHVVVTFVMEHITDMSLEEFNQPNWLGGASIRRHPDYYELCLEGLFGVDGRFRAKVMKIEFQPGKPQDFVED
jgi:uncharacterized protein (DUF433 family)